MQQQQQHLHAMAPSATDPVGVKPPARPVPGPVCGEVKPRLTKEQHDVLENRFLKENKPSTNAKKGLAEGLNVPLEKVNNWFQNRRAKKKQDERKKQQSQIMTGGYPHAYSVQYPPTMDHFSQPSQNPMGQHDLNWSTPNLSAGVVPMENSGPYGQQRFASSQIHIPQNFGQLHSINETSILGSHEVDSKAILQNFSSAGYPISRDQTFFEMSQSRPPSDFPSNGRYEFGRSMSVSDASPSYGHTFGNESLTELSNYSTSANASMHALVEPHTMASDAPGFSASHSTSGSLSSCGGNPMPILTTGMQDWVSDDNSPVPFSTGSFNEGSIEGSVGNLQQLDSTSPQDPNMWPNYVGTQDMQQDMYLHSNNNSTHQILSSNPEQVDGISIQIDHSAHDPNAPLPEDDFGRRTSSSSALADSMGHVGIHGNDLSGDVKQIDRPSSSLYSRRQRPRPTTLNKNALRSSSYSAASPASPRGFDSQNALRHVRSMGVMAPRIQKSGNNSAQRSPRHFSLADGNAAVNYQALNSPCISTQGGTLAPPTPLSPNEMAYQSGWSKPGMSTSQSPGPQLGPDAIPVPWGADSGVSPPATPGNPYRLGMTQQRINSTSVLKDTPPQSAPATQQAFPRSSYLQCPQPMQDPQMMMDFNNMQMPMRSHHMRRPSMPEPHAGLSVGQQMNYPVPTVTSADEMQQMLYPAQYRNDTPVNGLPCLPNGVPMYSGMVTVPSSAPQAEFQVHQYRPPTGPGAEHRHNQGVAKKNYTFSNQSLSDFNKSEE